LELRGVRFPPTVRLKFKVMAKYKLTKNVGGVRAGEVIDASDWGGKQIELHGWGEKVEEPIEEKAIEKAPKNKMIGKAPKNK
jgi:hypothetical protein